MNKTIGKLIASVLALIVAASLVGMSSYAWMNLSATPEMEGIQINIGGSNTVKVAADMTTVGEDGIVYHYPGEFSELLNFSQYETYDYLSGVAGLTPVSTADGVHWILSDISGESEYLVDDMLLYANMTADDIAQNGGNPGSYVYLDFWVVAPASSYRLRVSTGNSEEDSGSFVIALPQPGEDGNGGYTLVDPDLTATSMVRIGFLANCGYVGQTELGHYLGSDHYDSRYVKLMGLFSDPGVGIADETAQMNRFTIYEPNGDLHVGGADNGSYLVTEPLGVVNGEILPVDIRDRLTVQLANKWRTYEMVAQDGTITTSTLLAREFATAIVGREFTSMDEMGAYFYNQRLQGAYANYIDRGGFITKTGTLYDGALNGVVAADSAALVNTSGATEDVYITTLEKDVPQRIRMFIWLEAQDDDCTYHNGSSFVINLEFAGGNDEK